MSFIFEAWVECDNLKCSNRLLIDKVSKMRNLRTGYCDEIIREKGWVKVNCDKSGRRVGIKYYCEECKEEMGGYWLK